VSGLEGCDTYLKIFCSDILNVRRVCYTGGILDAFTFVAQEICAQLTRVIGRFIGQVQTMCKWQVFITPTHTHSHCVELEDLARVCVWR
jgi:hypothetical protein